MRTLARFAAVCGATFRRGARYASSARVAHACVAFALLTIVLFRLDGEEFHGDESHWVTSSQLAYDLIVSGDLDSPLWHDQFYLYTQPQLGKMAIGAALAAGGISGRTEVIEYDWLLDPEANRVRGAIPSNETLWFARLPGAIAGWLAAVVMWAIGRALGRTDVGLLSAALLASNPVWLANSRRAGMDTMALLFGLLAVYAAVQLLKSPNAWWWAAVGGAIGLTVSTKYTGLLCAVGAGVPLWLCFVRERERGRSGRFIVGGLGSVVVAVTIIVASNPGLYSDPVDGLTRSLGFFRDQAAAMRRSFPVFGSRPLVALEIVDRVIWPVGFPKIVDTTLERTTGDVERHLNPGQYGTPVIGGGIAIAAIAALAAKSRASWHSLGRIAAVGAIWFAASFGALVESLPIWWERWHLGIVPATCVVAAVGWATFGRYAMVAGGVAQVVATVAVGPSYLNHGFWALLATPMGVGLHAMAAGVIIIVALTAAGVPEWVRTRVRVRAVPRALFG